MGGHVLTKDEKFHTTVWIYLCIIWKGGSKFYSLLIVKVEKSIGQMSENYVVTDIWPTNGYKWKI